MIHRIMKKIVPAEVTVEKIDTAARKRRGASIKRDGVVEVIVEVEVEAMMTP